jgi:hypothetical protein
MPTGLVRAAQIIALAVRTPTIVAEEQPTIISQQEARQLP